MMATLEPPEVMTTVAMVMVVVVVGDGGAEAEEATAGEGIEVVVVAAGIVGEGVEEGGDHGQSLPPPSPAMTKVH